MAQEPFDSLTRREASQLAQGGRKEKAEIKSEIERTRIEMSETLGEIQERLRPDHLVQQAKATMTDAVTEAATGKVRNIMQSAGETATMVADQTKYAGRTVADYVRTHPVQMAMVAGGITWWLLRGYDRSDEWEGASEGWQDTGHRLDTDYDTDYAYRDRSLREKVGEYASTARETVGGYAASARETVNEAAEAARYRALRASERVSSAAQTASVRAQETWRSASTSADDWVREYPLAAGAIAVAVGAAIGLSVPGTEIENRALGERRDQAVEKARIAARQVKENVTQKVQNVAESVLDDVTATPTGSTIEPSQGRV